MSACVCVHQRHGAPAALVCCFWPPQPAACRWDPSADTQRVHGCLGTQHHIMAVSRQLVAVPGSFHGRLGISTHSHGSISAYAEVDCRMIESWTAHWVRRKILVHLDMLCSSSWWVADRQQRPTNCWNTACQGAPESCAGCWLSANSTSC